jgi:hypothetical protein
MEALCSMARRKARVADPNAPVYLFTESDVTPLGTLKVKRERIRALLPATPASLPLVLAWCVKSPSPVVVKARAVTAEQWENRHRLTYLGYDAGAHAFEFRIDAMPELPRLHRVIGPTNDDEEEAPRPAPSLRPCCVRRGALKGSLWVDRDSVVEWLAADDAASLTADAARAYASSALFMLEQRALCMQQIVSHDTGMDRMRHGLHFLFPDLAHARLAASASFVAAILVPALLNGLLTSERPAGPGKPLGGDRRALAEMLTERSSPALRLAAAWLESEDAFVHHLLCDPDEGMAACPQCGPWVLEQLEAALVANASALPWIRALGLVTDEGAVSLLQPAQEPEWYTVPRSLAYRLPVDRDRLVEDPETGAWRARRDVILQDVVPLLADRLAYETLWTLFGAAQAKDAPDSIVHATDRATAALTETRTYLLETLGRTGADADLRRVGEWQAHLETPEQAHRRQVHPLAPAPLPAAAAAARGDASGDPLAWYAELREQYKEVAAQVPDVEDLLRRDLLPPCIKHAVETARADGTMHNYMARFRYAGWMADMGYDAAGAMQLVALSNDQASREIGAHVESVNRHRQAGMTPSFQCKSNMNSPEERVTNCVMRRQVYGPDTTSTKLSDATQVAQVRRACTATMPGEQRPRFSISHPLDYVVLRLRQESA